MITKEQWEKIVKEFGGKAFNRVSFGFLEPTSNGAVEKEIEEYGFVTFKPLPELIALDVEFYDNAYKMWQWNGMEIGWVDFESNDELLNRQEWINIRRKDSAGLPFDLERAKAGDAVEERDGYDNDCTGLITTSWTDFEFEEETSDDPYFLRMTFPTRAKPPENDNA